MVGYLGREWDWYFPPDSLDEDTFDLMDEDVEFIDEQEEEEEEEDGEGEEEEEEDEEESGDEVQVVYPPWMEPPAPEEVMVPAEEGNGDDGEEGESSGCGWNREDMEGLICPICMEAWSNVGDHQPSCLPCGHLYGMSCVKKWLQQRRNSGKCPQCNQKCTLKDVRRIYGSRVVVIDEESNKKIRSLEAKCESFSKKEAAWNKKESEWLTKEAEWQQKETDLQKQVRQLTEKTSSLARSLESRPSVLDSIGQQQIAFGNSGLTFGCTASLHSFMLEKELPVDGARLFDVDDAGQIAIIVRRPSRIGESHTLTKMSLISPHDEEDIQLPLAVKAVRDLHFAPSGRLALLSSRGKKLAVVSLETNNMILKYDLPVPAWSCAWDLNCSNYVYAGLQNGMLLVFDTRQTIGPLESKSGLSFNPIHTIQPLPYSLAAFAGTRSVLTASSIGVCQWDIGGAQNEPILVTEKANPGVCISLAYSPATNDIVATFRPRVELSNELPVSQPSLTPSMGHSVPGSHVHIKRTDTGYKTMQSSFANVPNIRLAKSTIISTGNEKSLFAFGDEATSDLILNDLPYWTVNQRLTSYFPVRDIKYTSSSNVGLLSCLSGEFLQLFSRKLV